MMDDVKVRACKIVTSNGKTVCCRECGDPAWIQWRRGRRLAFYCLDCAQLLGLTVSSKIAAKDFCVTTRTVREWCRKGQLASLMFGERWIIFKPYNKVRADVSE